MAVKPVSVSVWFTALVAILQRGANVIEANELEGTIDRLLQISTDASIIFTVESVLREELGEMLKELDSNQTELEAEKYLELRHKLLERCSSLQAHLTSFAQSSSFSKVQKFREEQLKIWTTDNFEKRLAGFFIKSAHPGSKQQIDTILQDEFDPLLLELTLRQEELGEKKYQRYQTDLWERKRFLSALLSLIEEEGKIPREIQIKGYVKNRLKFVCDPFTDEHFGKQKQNVRTALTKVVSKIWDEAKKELYLVEGIFVGQTAFAHWTRHPRPLAEGNALCYVAQIYLPGSILYEHPAQIRHIIAHEIAHVLDQHGLSSKLSEDEKETEAQNMATKWGFPPQKKQKGEKPKER